MCCKKLLFIFCFEKKEMKKKCSYKVLFWFEIDMILFQNFIWLLSFIALFLPIEAITFLLFVCILYYRPNKSLLRISLKSFICQNFLYSLISLCISSLTLSICYLDNFFTSIPFFYFNQAFTWFSNAKGLFVRRACFLFKSESI